ncbi:MAG: response regulator [Magnetococcales bacterium]|nr:response regulator [Magnetococcales bacterium]
MGKKKVFIVDDDKELVDYLSIILEDEYQVDTASDGVSALSKIKRGTLPDLMILDINMPVMNGLEVCKNLRKDNRTKTLPIIFLTIDAESEVKGLNLGAVDYLVKPIDDPEKLLARVQSHIKNLETIKDSERSFYFNLYWIAVVLFIISISIVLFIF